VNLLEPVLSFALQVAAKTDVGCVRAGNEDNFGYDIGRGIFVVCDGMGGQAAGEVASKIAVDTLLGYFHEGSPKTPDVASSETFENFSERARALGYAIQSANHAIREAAGRCQGQAGMGSTIACVRVDDNFVSFGHVGDSRIYLVREGAIQQLTQDHSLVMQEVRLGLLSSQEAEQSQLQNVITRALGPEETVEPDLDEMIAAADDVLILASDGLTRVLRDQEILAAVTTADNLSCACNDLIQLAKEAQCDDNVTCLLIRFSEERWYQTCLRRFRFWGSDYGKVVS
jgi:serine/threonine protein phosphatase PrpC